MDRKKITSVERSSQWVDGCKQRRPNSRALITVLKTLQLYQR